MSKPAHKFTTSEEGARYLRGWFEVDDHGMVYKPGCKKSIGCVGTDGSFFFLVR